MEKIVLRQIIMLSKYFVYGFVVQLFFTAVLLANTSNAQRESIHKIKTSISANDQPLEIVLRELEQKTHLRFTFNDNYLEAEKVRVDIDVKNGTLADILSNISAQSNLRFTRINDNIHINVAQSNARPDVEEFIRDVELNKISGKVISEEDGQPLPGVTVKVKATQMGTVTNIDGEYNIDAAIGDVLVFSFVGFKVQERVVQNQSIIDVTMEQDLAQLEEFVVVGYGEQNKVNLTGSIVTVSAEEFENRNVSNPIQALQGKVAGLRVTQSTGAPGNEDISFQIRGVNSFSSDSDISTVDKNKPLVLINGLVGNLSDLDPAFIESITVLKDAASASIYGARAANGVILVTTKKGAPGKSTISYTGRVMNQRMINTLDRDWNSVNFMEKVNTMMAPHTGRYYSEEVINNFRNNTSDEFPNFNHEDFYLHDVTVQSHNIQMGGSSEKTRYNIGLGYWGQDGIADGFDFKKTNAVVNIESQLNNRIKVGAYVSGTSSKRKEPYNGERDYLMGILSQSPTYKPWLLDGSGRYTGSNNGSMPESLGYADVSSKNAFAISNSPSALTYDNRFAINANIFTEVNLMEGLNWYTKAGADIVQGDYKNRRPVLRMYSYRSGEFLGNLDNIGSEQLIHRVSNSQHYTLFSYLDYKKSISEDHNLGLMIGGSQETDSYETIGGSRRGFASPSLDVLSGAPSAGQTNDGNINEFVLQSIFGRFTYDFRSKYLFEANFRRDGSSRFSEDNRWGFFPSFSAGWRISEENFLQDASSWLSNLKFRVSYGKMGNDLVGLYPYQSVLTLGMDYPFSGSLEGGAIRQSLSNEDIKWEETEVTDFGIDLNIRNNLFSMTFDYYDKTTSGILRLAQLPLISGLLPPFVNEGVVNNKGFEVILGHQNSVGDFNYGANFNFSKYKNKLVTFGTRTFGTNAMIEGKEMNRFFMYQADGIYQSQEEIDNGPTPRWPAKPGDIRYKDIDGDGAITPDDRIDVDGVNPDFFYGFEFSAQWKGFDAAIFFQGEKGRKVLINNEWSLVMPFSVHGANPITWWDDAWTPENPSTSKPRAIWYGAPEGQSIKEANTYWLREASYLRLKNLNVGYSIPKEILDDTFISGVRVFFNAENLLTFSKFEFGDPERPSDNLYPMFRTLTFGATVKF
ncbi:SusC/RagA family TonB-linked outer membrane protein [Echinicola shivajiensis]|uniref:SusC/RagA family TonB-linked outer membrane protein n=1 Tax=Echinicola shivajiensis TaxID=1035916 RepID=UPI001BFCB6BF|nr:SusC/RagA family TonB-linked outer membrane protein [Echinicola shivajiensis]